MAKQRPEIVDGWGLGGFGGPKKNIPKGGGEASHLLECFRGPPGPPRLLKIDDFRSAQPACIVYILPTPCRTDMRPTHSNRYKAYERGYMSTYADLEPHLGVLRRG